MRHKFHRDQNHVETMTYFSEYSLKILITYLFIIDQVENVESSKSFSFAFTNLFSNYILHDQNLQFRYLQECYKNRENNHSGSFILFTKISFCTKRQTKLSNAFNFTPRISGGKSHFRIEKEKKNRNKFQVPTRNIFRLEI